MYITNSECSLFKPRQTTTNVYINFYKLAYQTRMNSSNTTCLTFPQYKTVHEINMSLGSVNASRTHPQRVQATESAKGIHPRAGFFLPDAPLAKVDEPCSSLFTHSATACVYVCVYF